jgi:uncharacterized membrane-anchored protein
MPAMGCAGRNASEHRGRPPDRDAGARFQVRRRMMHGRMAAMIIAAVAILIPVLLLVWLVLTIDKGVLQLRRIADELQRQRESKPSV